MAWLGSAWKYRKQITIAGTADGIQTNYQMKLVINRSAGADSGGNVYVGSRCESDYDDIRITNSDGATLRDYWVESSDVNSATIWIEFDSIAASPANTNFYIYYGNPAASAVSSGANTFPFFDDFDGTLTDKWTVAGSAVNAAGVCTLIRTGGVDAMITAKTSYPMNRRTRARCKSEHTLSASYHEQMFWWYQEQQSRCCYSGVWGGIANAIYGQYNGSGPTTGIIGGWAAGVYAIQDILRRGTTSVIYRVDNANEIVLTGTVPSNAVNHAIGFAAETTNDSKIYVDWAWVGNYTYTEPTWSTWGAEEGYGVRSRMSMGVGC